MRKHTLCIAGVLFAFSASSAPADILRPPRHCEQTPCKKILLFSLDASQFSWSEARASAREECAERYKDYSMVNAYAELSADGKRYLRYCQVCSVHLNDPPLWTGAHCPFSVLDGVGIAESMSAAAGKALIGIEETMYDDSGTTRAGYRASYTDDGGAGFDIIIDAETGAGFIMLPLGTP